MSSLSKILLALLALVVIALGIEGFLYLKFQSPKATPSPVAISSPTPPAFVDITGSVTLVGSLNLVDIGKPQVEEWAKASGPTDVPAYSGPLPTLPPDVVLPSGVSTISPQVQPTSVKILAGFYKGISQGSLSISQGSGPALLVSFSQGSRLWIKTGDKLQIAVPFVDSMLASGYLDQMVGQNDLVLVTGVTGEGQNLKGLALIVFR